MKKMKKITRHNGGASAEHVIDKLRKFAIGWIGYFGISLTYREVLELDAWMRRRVKLSY
jgi:RNA-directed DNA polymerase